MRYLWIILLLMLPVLASAGNEVIDPDADINPNEWSPASCTNHYDCVSDNNDNTYLSISNAGEGYREMFSFANATTTESTIDSVVYTIRWLPTHVNNTVSIDDSLSGYALRSEIIATTTIGVWQDSTVIYTTAPDGGSWTWPKVNNLMAGFTAVNVQNKQQTSTAEFWARVYYIAAETPWLNKIQSINGAGKVQDISDTTRIHHP